MRKILNMKYDVKFLFVVKLGYLVHIKIGSDRLTVFLLHIPSLT